MLLVVARLVLSRVIPVINVSFSEEFEVCSFGVVSYNCSLVGRAWARGCGWQGLTIPWHSDRQESTAVRLATPTSCHYALRRVQCRGKFVAPGKFFPPPNCHNVTNANPNPKFNPILTLTHTAACGNNFPVRRIFHYTGNVAATWFRLLLVSMTLLEGPVSEYSKCRLRSQLTQLQRRTIRMQ